MLQIVLDWLAKLLNLPSCFLAYGPDGKLGRGGGVIQVGHFPPSSWLSGMCAGLANAIT